MKMEKEELKMCFEMGLEMGLERKGGLRVRYFDSKICPELQVMWPVCCVMWPNGLRDLWRPRGICGGFADGFRMIGKASVASESSFTLDMRASLARSWVEELRGVFALSCVELNMLLEGDIK